MTTYYDGDTFSHDGREFRINIVDDEDSGAPWDRADGHGVVSDWTTRDKRPGERVLNTDRSSKRYYDVQASIAIAKRDGWDAQPYGGTKGERAARAVDADFEYLRRWCNDQWRYVGVVVTLLDEDGEDAGESESLWGIESESDDYIAETAREYAGQICARLDKEQTERAEWEARDVMTKGA